jgi:hypothetical protein
LLGAVLDRSRLAGSRRCRRCIELSTPLRFLSVRAALHDLLQDLEVTHSEPMLAPLLTGQSPEFDIEPVMLMEAFIDLLDDLARRSPIALGLEDLQWADESAAELLTYVVRHVFDQRAPARDVPKRRAAARPSGHRTDLRCALAAVERIELGGLERNELRAFVRARANVDPTKTSSMSSGGVRVAIRSSRRNCCTRTCTAPTACPRRLPTCCRCGSIRSRSTPRRSSRRRRCSATTRRRISWCESWTDPRAPSTTPSGSRWTRRC